MISYHHGNETSGALKTLCVLLAPENSMHLGRLDYNPDAGSSGLSPSQRFLFFIFILFKMLIDFEMGFSGK